MPFDFACPDWFEKLQRGETPIADLPLDEAEADRAVAMFNKLRVPDAIGQPTLAEAAGEWIRDIVRAIFGSMQTSPDAYASRQVGEVFILVPKKNAKSTSAAAIAIVFLLMNRRPNADMLIIGPTQKISDVAFEQARGMIEADPFLSNRFHIIANQKTVKDRTNGARLMVRTFGMDVLTGAKPIFCLIDEIHLLGTISYAADVMRQVRGGMLPFAESLLVMITTQSDHPPAGVFKTELQYARAVRDGTVTDRVRLLPVLYEFPEHIQRDDNAWQDPALWHLVTPNLGRSLTMDALLDGWERAQHDGKGEVIAWATQHLNVEVGLALHSNRWIGADFWLAARDDDDDSGKLLTLDALIDRCEVAVAGVDGGGLDDLLGLAIVGRCRTTRRWLGWAHAWANKIVLDRRQDIAPQLREFEAEGDLTICDMPGEDHAGVCDFIGTLLDADLLPEEAAVGLDPAGVAALVTELAAIGIPPGRAIAVGQGYRMNPAIKGMERKLMDGTFRHAGQGLMRWSVQNARAELRGNAVMITKEQAGTAKIDPLIAMFNAFTLMTRNPIAKPKPDIDGFLRRPVMVA
jgi:phage terminase large subunit-like protein